MTIVYFCKPYMQITPRVCIPERWQHADKCAFNLDLEFRKHIQSVTEIPAGHSVHGVNLETKSTSVPPSFWYTNPRRNLCVGLAKIYNVIFILTLNLLGWGYWI